MNELLNQITVGNKKNITKSIVFNVLASLSNIIPFFALASIVGRIFEYYKSGCTIQLITKDFWTLWIVMLVFMVVTFIFENIACMVTYRDGYISSATSRVRLAEHIRKVPLGTLMDMDLGALGNAMMNDLSKTESGMTHVVPQIISGTLVGIISSVFMLIFDVRMGISMLIGLPIALLILMVVKSVATKLDTKKVKAQNELTKRLQEYLYGMKIIKSYHMQGENFKMLKNACVSFRDACIESECGVTPLNLVAVSFLRSGVSFMTLMGVYLLKYGKIDVTVFAMFLLVGTRVFDPMSVAIVDYAHMLMAGEAGKRILNLLRLPVMEGDNRATDGGELTFDNVTFSYKDSVVLNNASMVFPAEKMTALVGPSGSGKSTVLKLAARFYDADCGTVKAGDVDAKDVDPEQWMKNISMVFQDVYLFSDTVENNIRYGKEDATKEEIIQAAKLANCYDFIMKMENGFDTMIGEGGSTLSGGEKQRISIARAILKNAPIVLLDEATSSLDPENEREIQKAISTLIKGRTVIVVAHKLKTIENADQIYVLDKGSVKESGTHKELLNQGGLYAKLWNLQMNNQGWKIQ